MFSKKDLRSSGIGIFAVVTVVILLQINEGYSADSPKLVGKYVYDANSDEKTIHKVLLEYGFEKEDIPNIDHFTPETTKEIAVDGNRIKITHSTSKGNHVISFINGKEVDEPYLLRKAEYVTRTTVTIEGPDRLSFKRIMPKKGRSELVEVLECREDGCSSILSAGKETVTMVWKRISLDSSF